MKREDGEMSNEWKEEMEKGVRIVESRWEE